MSWRLIQTIKGREDLAHMNLVRQGYESYLPVVRSDKRVSVLDYQPLFSGYLFCRLQPGIDDFHPIRSTRGVVRLVQFGELPAIVPQELIDRLRAQEDDNGIHQICKYDYEAGDKIRVTVGPFEGYTAIFRCRDSAARVSILLDGVRKLQLSYRDIAPIS